MIGALTPGGRSTRHRTYRLAGLVGAAGLVVAAMPATSVAGPAVTAVPAAPTAACDNRNNNTISKLLECASADNAVKHLEAFQAIADANDGNRSAGTAGYDATVDYVVETMEAAGYDVTVQDFDFLWTDERSEMERIFPDATVYQEGVDFIRNQFDTGTPQGEATGLLVPIDITSPDLPDNSSTSGCEAADFIGFQVGGIALVQRGTCPFADKVLNAQAAGAAGVIVMNEGQPGRTGLIGMIGPAPGLTIPAVFATSAVGFDLFTTPGAEVRVKVEFDSEVRQASNVFAETRKGRDDNVVMVGAHLDSVPEGPGINDNGSGSAALLEVAEKMRKVNVPNKVRFAWWGAEERGLLGSDHYVFGLTQEEQDDIALYLNFDMVASPNYVRFIYDGDGSAFGLEGPAGSEVIEALYEDFYRDRGLEFEPTEISFRSDYAAFFDVGIPFGGLFTGAEGVKTPEEAVVYGGTAGEQYDPCYHLACDTIDNINAEVYEVNIDAIALSTLTYAYSTETVNDVPGKRVPGRSAHGVR
jgi:Zn-dependent M28 family amino/carboxypeptidase